jgi:hypothetical protein
VRSDALVAIFAGRNVVHGLGRLGKIAILEILPPENLFGCMLGFLAVAIFCCGFVFQGFPFLCQSFPGGIFG